MVNVDLILRYMPDKLSFNVNYTRRSKYFQQLGLFTWESKYYCSKLLLDNLSRHEMDESKL